MKLIHLYPQAMSLYGEYANLVLLTRLLEELGEPVERRTVEPGEAPDLAGADLVYMGAGTERTQKAALAWLAPHREALGQAAEHGLVLFTGNAMELLGASITDRNGTLFQGLGFGDFATVETDKRVPHDVIARTGLFEAPVVGFMNKCSVTSGVDNPLFTALDLGAGNERDKGPEGFYHGNVIGTHITGPVLVKNPAFLTWVADKLYKNRGETMPPVPAGLDWMDMAQRAYQVTLEELSALLR
ncbi:hypothetical protein [Pseudoflavonifractor phocaeensis]|uniref:hypothetical protein n=1 Tax=Pseudoflavonifractor phocaeensis TaxID=1870988 RepID=UPI0019562B6F|nr:hypothetical protein [Pseudoflavonifractor phocaeensis]MBM6927349.1 hypothetical protein [Pseudoflavonifractor phocaeensis]